ncbi:16S rRNA (guanine(527)-N(7))-methyltransferase RsmG [Sulfurimonas sp. HSL3-7]|uniref:16S rRNA (guanine(527)-N(7))-methyltransferase RsmG n=1 Tax=Sulfonitrofixus jiaomeiensis TaxID=3131938 RepID=UPI0031F752D8
MDIQAALKNDNIELDEQFFKYVERYKEHLKKWNKIHNLTGAKNDELIDKFIYDAVYPVSFLPEVKTILDIGTGAGFPGMILAFALPQTEVILCEPLQKRASFLQFIKADLGLKNVTVANCRVEELEPRPIELVTSRAVTDTKMLMQLSKPFVHEGSRLLFYKGEKVFDEVDPALKHQIIQTKKRHYLIIEI